MAAVGAVLTRCLLHTSANSPRLAKFVLNAPKSGSLEMYGGGGGSLERLMEGSGGSPAIDGRRRWFGSGRRSPDQIDRGAVEVNVEFSDGNVFILSAEFLRIYSPAADSKIRSVCGEKVIFGRRHVGIMSAIPVGNYGVRIVFDDLHKTGIYTWDYFYHLGSNKFTLMRNYIKTLKKHGLSRDPQSKKI